MSFFTDIIILLNTITLEIGEVISDVEGAYADFIDTLTLTETIAFYIAEIALIIGIVETVIQLSTNLKTGINNHVNCGATEFSYGADNFGFTFKILWECVWEKFISFWNGECTIYYMIDIIFGIIYAIMIKLPVILIRAIFGIDLQPVVDGIYEMFILPLNDFVFLITGFYITKWDDSVTQKCFRCKGVYKGVPIYKTFNEWAQLNLCNMSQMKNGFVKIFESVIPSDKWTKWLNNENTPDGISSQEGSTNWPPFN
jgi:hypothetical protein